MKFGFTGTRKGMSKSQKRQLNAVFDLADAHARVSAEHYGNKREWELHHGGAVGADIEAERMAELYGSAVISAHYPAAGESPLVRNRQIVSLADVLIAAPEQNEEQLRSGTWATIRYARKAGKPVIQLSR